MYLISRKYLTKNTTSSLSELKNLEEQHPQLITPDSPTQRVSGRPIEGFAQVKHAIAMLSIDNTYSADELRAFR